MSRVDEARYREAEKALFAALDVSPEEIWVDTPSARLRLLAVGQGPPVLFVHGSPNASPTWLPLVASLGRRALLLERPGAGLSAPATWRDYRPQVVAMLEAVLDALGLEQVDVVGSSFGGLYAYYLALDAPGRVRKLVQMSGPAGPLSVPMPSIFRLLCLLPLVPFAARLAPRPDVAGAMDMFREIGHGPAIDSGRMHPAWFPWYSALLRHTDTVEHLAREVRALVNPLGYRSGRGITDAELSRIQSRLLYLWGNDDPFGGAETGRALAALTPGACIEHFAGMGHIPWMDDPARIAGRLNAFLD